MLNADPPRFRSFATAMSTSLDVLPGSNEEYGTREYWYTTICQTLWISANNAMLGMRVTAS
jgi:hypothetical protein